MNPRLLLVSVILLICVLSFSAPFHSFAVGPVIVNQYDAGRTTSANNVNKTITVTAGNTLVVGATQAVRAGSPTGLTISSTTSTCQTAVNNNNHGAADNQIAIDICPNSSGGSTLVQAVSAGSCGGGQPCGFMSLWIFELQGGNYVYTNTSGTNANAGSASELTNTISYSPAALDLGFSSINTAFSAPTPGGLFLLTGTGCYQSGVNNALYGCADKWVDGSTGSTNFPWTINQSSSWADEGIAISGGPAVTSTVISTVTGWNVLGGQTPFNWFLMALLLLGFPAGMWTVMRWFGPSSENIVWITLIGLFIGAIIGTVVGFNAAQPFVPMGITIFYGAAIVLYIIKARGRGDLSS